MDSIFTLMQNAVDIVGASEHPANKIAATLAGADAGGKEFSLSKVNYWPEPIKRKIGTETQIGNSSGTVHAETACLLAAPRTENSSLFVTDPPCPNCVKNMAEAGVKNLYIDHKGFNKDFAARRMTDFEMMSMRICEKSGINVFKVFRKERHIEPLLIVAEDYKPVLERPARIEKIFASPDFKKIINEGQKFYDRRTFAAALAKDKEEKLNIISAEIHAIPGFTAHGPQMEEGKYNLFLQPVHRLLMTAARHGLKIEKDYLYSSRVPTAREQVNLVGAGFTQIWLGDDHHARDEHGLQALQALMEKSIFKITTI